MPNGVACSVSNCSYWDQGNLCGAKEIVVEVDHNALNKWNEEFADEFFSHTETAPTSSVTCCLTFKPKSKE